MAAALASDYLSRMVSVKEHFKSLLQSRTVLLCLIQHAATYPSDDCLFQLTRLDAAFLQGNRFSALTSCDLNPPICDLVVWVCLQVVPRPFLQFRSHLLTVIKRIEKLVWHVIVGQGHIVVWKNPIDSIEQILLLLVGSIIIGRHKCPWRLSRLKSAFNH